MKTTTSIRIEQSFELSGATCRFIATCAVLIYRYTGHETVTLEVFGEDSPFGADPIKESVDLNFGADPAFSQILDGLTKRSDRWVHWCRPVRCVIPEDTSRTWFRDGQENHTLVVSCEDENGRAAISLRVPASFHDHEEVRNLARRLCQIVKGVNETPDQHV